MKNSREKERELMDSLRQLDQQYDELRIDCDKKDEEIVQLKTKENEIVSETRRCGLLIIMIILLV